MATITSAGTGNSNATATWVGGVVPDADDDVVIDSGHTVTQNANATFNSLALNGTFVASSSYSLTIDGENSSGQAFIANSGTFTHGNGTVTITTPAATNIYFKTENPLNNLIINHSSAVVNLAGNPDDLKCEGDLTITAGTLQSTNSGATLEVDGDASVTGTLNWSGTSGGAVELGSLTINSGGTYSATSGTTTVTSETSGGYTWRNNGGTFTHNNGTVTTNSSVDTKLRENTFYNLIINQSSSGKFVYWEDTSGNTCTVANDLTITTGRLRGLVASDTVTVTGDVTVSADGTFNHTSVWTGSINHGSLTIASGGTYNATSGTTTINSESSAGNAILNSGTFTHNKGTVAIDTDATTQANEGPYYNFKTTRASLDFYPNGALDIQNNLDIVGDFDFQNNSHHLTVRGNMTVGDGSTTTRYGQQSANTNNLTVEGLLTVLGSATADLGTHTTVNLGGIRNVGGTIT